MSMTQTTTEVTPSGDPHCQSCGSKLPPQATFCASCGERVIKQQITSLLQDNQDIASSYRITSLLRRRPYVSLYLATDIRLQRPVALRDIDISSLDTEGRNNAAVAVQCEYDLLRRQHIPYVISLMDVRHFQGHLYVVAGWPHKKDSRQQHMPDHSLNHLNTLQDILQSGNGLPQESLALTWIDHLCQSLQAIHASGIVVADLDPQTIIFNGNTYASDLALMVSWLPPSLRSLFPRTSTIANTTNYTAPEVLLGKPEPRSDIYSLGALLYLLLTGTPPEEPMARTQRRLRLPGELNARSTSTLDDFIMKSLALDATERFSTADEMREALAQVRSGKRISAGKEPSHKNKTQSSANNILPIPTEETLIADTSYREPHGVDEDNTVFPIDTDNDTSNDEQRIEKIVSSDTVLITPLSSNHHTAWQASLSESEPANEAVIEAAHPAHPSEKLNEPDEDEISDFRSSQSSQNADALVMPDSSIGQRFKRHITGILPAISRPTAAKATNNAAASIYPAQPDTQKSNSGAPSFFQQLQRLLLGEQKQTTNAAAIIETPLRVQPNQHYQIRIHIMGRSHPQVAPDSKVGAIAGGLSALVEGDLVSIEVRSALYQNYAYVVQQATVQIPESGYAAEVTIPMHPLSHGPSGRRDRLHIFFMDERRRSLYEKPFVVELFISHLVQPGREGHNVLTIPL